MLEVDVSQVPQLAQDKSSSPLKECGVVTLQM